MLPFLTVFFSTVKNSKILTGCKISVKKNGPRKSRLVRGALICRVDRKTASCAFYVSTRQAFGQILTISLPRRRIIGLLLYSGCQCGKSDRKILEGEARQGGSPFPRTKKAPAGARRRACLCPRHRDDEQRHTSPGAAGVFEGAAPPVLMVRGC